MKREKNLVKSKHDEGFTLIEILIVIGLIAILAAVVLVAINPERQFALARNTQRLSNVNALANAITQNSADNKGIFKCAAGVLPQAPTEIGTKSGNYDARSCIVPTYISEIPTDPSTGNFTDPITYSTGYQIVQDPVTKRVSVIAPSAELGENISSTR